MIGDGVTLVYHCEYINDVSGYAPDAGPIYCGFVDTPGVPEAKDRSEAIDET